MTSIIRMTRHPSDDDVVVIKFDPELNDAIKFFQPARQALDLGGYILLGEHVAQLYRWARHVDAHVVDERTGGKRRNTGPQRPPAECRHCQQPGSVTNPPRRCPSCGEHWEPIAPPVRAAAAAATHECGSCGHKQRGRFPFCGKCGADMPDLPPATNHPRFAPEPLREHLDDPLPLSDIVEHAVRLPTEIPEPRPTIHQPSVVNGRPVADAPSQLDDADTHEHTPDPQPEPEPATYDPWAIPTTTDNGEPLAEWERDHLAAQPPDDEPLASSGQLTQLHILFGEAGLTDRDDKLAYCTAQLDREVESTKTLTRSEYATVRDMLRRIVNAERLAEHRRTGEAPE